MARWQRKRPRSRLLPNPRPSPRADWTLIGKKSPSKLSIPDVANGSAVFGIDVKLPGMVHAALLQVPVMGGRLKSRDRPKRC